jgi:hypothetical protein
VQPARQLVIPAEQSSEHAAGQAFARYPLLEIDWLSLGLFMGSVLLVALYGLTASGHFPAEFRPPKLQRGPGRVVLWTSMLATGLAGLAALVRAWSLLPWYAVLIGGGAMLLFAPLLLQPLPDSFVDGRRGLLAFSAGAVLLAGLMWWRA